MKDSIVSDKKNYKRWRKSSSMDGWEKSVSVDEIENGFIIEIYESGEKNGKYQDSCKRYYSKDNPLSDDFLKKDEDIAEVIENYLKDM